MDTVVEIREGKISVNFNEILIINLRTQYREVILQVTVD